MAAVVVLGSGSVSAAPAQDGQWSAPISWPIVAVHMSLEPTGQVFMLDGFGNAPNSERLWNPATGTFQGVPYGRNLFCAGHIQLYDGRTLIVGGHITANEGLADTTLFDPVSKTYVRGQDMSVGRWYPTVTQLPDGRVLTLAGDNIQQDRPGAEHPFSDASVDSLPSVYDPKVNTWTDLQNARLTSPLYPYLFVLSDGRVVDAGPDRTTRILDPATWTWSTVATSSFDGHSAVMYRPNKIMKSGTWADPDFFGASTYNANGATAVIDMSAPTPAWRNTASMALGRSYHNLTLLPDGTVLASGGMSTSDGTDLTKAVKPAEIWNPDTETWTTVASLQDGREYHSTALLLPDGRVLMAGGGALPGRATDQLTGEIYSPPYLFNGARPTITSAPGSAGYGASFDVTTPDAAQVSKVSLIRLPSVTHAFDQNQRFQFLSFTAGSGKITVQAPANPNLAPPGDYMLFILNGNNVPSVASMIRISAAGDTTPPTAPSGLAANPGSSGGQVALSWNAASDPGGILLRYNVHRSTTANFTPSAANLVGQPTGISFTDTGLAAGTYYYKVVAEDANRNLSAASNQASLTLTVPADTGLVAAYGFDEGSGATTTDKSGNGNTGTLANTAWSAAGKFGNALSFNGTNASVTAADSTSLHGTSALTVEAWVRPTALGGYNTIVLKENNGYYAHALYANTSSNRPTGNVFTTSDHEVPGAAQLPLNTWTHLAATYDGTALRVYVNGTQSGTQSFTGAIASSAGPLKIGGNSIWGEYFNGLIDEVRVYDRALTAAEIQNDMNRAITSPDAVAPSAPGTLTAAGGLGQVSLAWGAATDNVGVVRYNVHRGTTAGFTPSAANRIAQPTGLSYVDTGLAAGTYFYKLTAEDAAGNVGPAGNEATATATADTTPPTAPSGLVATASPGQVALTWGASSDAGGIARYNVHRSTTAGFTPSAANRIAQPTGTSYTDPGLTGGTYYYRVVAEDGAGNLSSSSNEANATVPAGPPAGLVAQYGFDEGVGTTVADSSGSGNNGILSGPTWAATGKYGKALTFDGVNDLVNVADANSLDLTTGMTLEAWVRPTALGNSWRTALMKEAPGSTSYTLYAHGTDSGSKVPLAEIFSAGYRDATGTAAIATNTWTHLAATYNGTVLALYVNGTQAGQLLHTGSITPSTGQLRIGGNTVWSEYFQGDIDEVRVYNRALTAGEIQADMNRPVTNADATPPSAPGTLSATGGLSSAQLSWGAATDNVGVVRYNVHRSTSAGFTPSAANRIAQPTGTSYTDSVAAGTYFYKVTAEDAAGNVGAASNEATATVGDTAPPQAPGTLTATGGIGAAQLSWGAAADNVGV
ncbi:MAG TPA: LamG-like jellyroll fold domain-containing protein, partial [Gaiellaceae bacterium]|nr:LamG-like jellyroll fold domain-containing protein [Gaiellaceae bacterium]